MFQSTHSRGVRHSKKKCIGRYSQCFNPRTHEECDLIQLLLLQLIHGFNPRTHEECDPAFVELLFGWNVFQSTHSRGVRRKLLPAKTSPKSFNPRTHEECDFLVTWLSLFSDVSIHALTRSATNLNNCQKMDRKFQSTHSRGVRRHCFPNPALRILFQSTHSRGVRPHIFFLFYFQIFRTRFSRIFLKNIKSKR